MPSPLIRGGWPAEIIILLKHPTLHQAVLAAPGSQYAYPVSEDFKINPDRLRSDPGIKNLGLTSKEPCAGKASAARRKVF